METIGQKIGKLIDALNDGFILYKEFNEPFFKDKLFLIKFKDHYELKGWGSALVTYKDCLFEITQEPDDWKIFPDFNINIDQYPYPWSVNQSKK